MTTRLDLASDFIILLLTSAFTQFLLIVLGSFSANVYYDAIYSDLELFSA